MATEQLSPTQTDQQDKIRQERVFLEGPQPRKWELWSLFKIMRELLTGFRVLHFVGPCVTVFGSARFKEDHPHYELARRVGEAAPGDSHRL